MCYPEAASSASAGRTCSWARSPAARSTSAAAQFEYWEHTQLIIDVVPGRGAGFSLEAPEGVRFLTRSRVFNEAEVVELDRQRPPPRAG